MIYEEAMGRVHEHVNIFVKRNARLFAMAVLVWAIPIAAEIGKIVGSFLLHQELCDLGLKTCFTARDGRSLADICHDFWGDFCKDISKLADLIYQLQQDYWAAKGKPGGAELCMKKKTEASWSLKILAGYCIGQGCGLETTNRLP